MAAGDRTKKIVGRVWAIIADGGPNIPAPVDRESLIHGAINDFQRRIAEEALCVETSANLTVSSGTTSEPSGFFRFKLIALPSGQTLQVEELDLTEYDYITRYSPTSFPQSPIYFKRWAGTLTFYPTPSNATYTGYYWKIPSTDVSTSVDPETPAIFDKAIEYGVLSDIAALVRKPDLIKIYHPLFLEELERVKSSWRRTKRGSYDIYYHDL